MSDETFTLNKAPGYFFDWTTFSISMALVAIGLLSIYSATYDSNMSSFFFRQLLSAAVGLGVLVGLVFIPESWLRLNSWVVYSLSLVLLVAVMFFGVEINGTKGWIRLGGNSLQPSELSKIGVLLAVAVHLAKKGVDIRTWRDFAIIIAIVAVPAYLIMQQPDFGTASVLFAMLFGILFWNGFDAFTMFFIVSLPVIIMSSLKGQFWFILIGAILSAASFAFRKNIVLTIAAISVFIGIGVSSPYIYDHLAPHQKARIDTFLKPGSNPLGAGYNVIQSVMAVGSGGVTGKGYLQGTQTQLRYIPMQWTDFIYSVPTEEFGFVGGAIVIFLHFALIWRAVKIASMVNNKFQSIICIGIASIFFYHCLINIGMAIGIMPVMGIPLPFMSYGGTSIIVNLAFVGMLLNVHRSYLLKRTA